MPHGRPKPRRVLCTRCGAKSGNRCQLPDGTRVDWHHIERIDAADNPVVGRSPLTITGRMITDGRRMYDDGASYTAIAAALGLSRSTTFRYVIKPHPNRRRST